MTQPTILIVDDEPSIIDNITYALSTEGFATVAVNTGADALAQLETDEFALVVLDIGLPDSNGFDIARAIRERYTTPIIFVTARADEIDRIVGLEIGADDYVVKPFSPHELSARVKAVLRRTVPAQMGESPVSDDIVESGDLMLDTARWHAEYCGAPLVLSKTEFRLLLVLAGTPDRVFSRQQLMDQAWEHGGVSLERTVDSHVKSLRRKIRDVADRDPILTHRGVGYSWRSDP